MRLKNYTTAGISITQRVSDGLKSLEYCSGSCPG